MRKLDGLELCLGRKKRLIDLCCGSKVMKYGYARAMKNDATIGSQIELLEQAGCESICRDIAVISKQGDEFCDMLAKLTQGDAINKSSL